MFSKWQIRIAKVKQYSLLALAGACFVGGIVGGIVMAAVGAASLGIGIVPAVAISMTLIVGGQAIGIPLSKASEHYKYQAKSMENANADELYRNSQKPVTQNASYNQSSQSINNSFDRSPTPEAPNAKQTNASINSKSATSYANSSQRLYSSQATNSVPSLTNTKVENNTNTEPGNEIRRRGTRS